MRTIRIQFDVNNSADVVKKQKGFLAGLAADLFLGRDKLKSKVEDAITKELVKGLHANLQEKFTEQGVQVTLLVEDEG